MDDADAVKPIKHELDRECRQQKAEDLLGYQHAGLIEAIADAVRRPGEGLDSAELDAAICALDADLARLREQRATAPFALDRMLPFWALVFNLREVAQDLNQLASTLPQLV